MSYCTKAVVAVFVKFRVYACTWVCAHYQVDSLAADERMLTEPSQTVCVHIQSRFYHFMWFCNRVHFFWSAAALVNELLQGCI